jgi:hypothetical protein
MLVVSTWMYSLLWLLLPPFSGTFTTVPSSIFSSAYGNPNVTLNIPPQLLAGIHEYRTKNHSHDKDSTDGPNPQSFNGMMDTQVQTNALGRCLETA